MIRINHILLPLLILLPLAFTSCGSEPAQINIVQKGDYSELLEAIRNADKTLSDKLDLIQEAVSSGLAGTQEAVELIVEALNTLEGTYKEKLAAIEQAVKDQNSSLETKLLLLEAAVSGGFTDAAGRQDLLLKAIQAISGTLEEKISAIEAAIKAQSTSLETKISLIEAAVKGGFADYAKAQELAAQAIDSMGGTAEEKLAAIEKAVKDGFASLEAKLMLIESAVKTGLAHESDLQGLVQAALNALEGSMEEKIDAIQTAMTSQSSGLETKIALIVSALENGFGGVNGAIANLQQALDTSLQGLDSSLAGLSSDISAKLQAIAGQLSSTELAKALQDVLDAIDGDQQSTEDLIQSIQDALDDIQTALGAGVVVNEIIYLGHPTEAITVSVGQPLRIPLRVNPSNAELTKDILSLDCLDSKQFFLSGADRSLAVKNHYPEFSLAPDQNNPGQYIATVRTLVDETYKYWDESKLVFKVRTGYDNGQPVYVSTQPIPVTIMPNPVDVLSVSGRENTASFLIDERPKRGLYLGIIYQPLVSIVFRDGSDTRVYTAEFLESAVFDQSWGPRIKAFLNRERHFVGLYPDTTDVSWRHLRDSTRISKEAGSGFLELTDRWGGCSGDRSPALPAISWYTSYADTVLADPTISVDGYLQANLASKVTKLGLNTGEHPGSTYCEVAFDFASASGVWYSAQFKPYSWDLEMWLAAYPASSRFTVDSVIKQTVQPDENDSSFRPAQRKVRIRTTFTVK